MLDLMTTPRIHPQVAARLLEGRAIIVLADAGEVLVLNPSGAQIWQQIDGRRTVRELAAGLAAGHGLDPASAQQDTVRFVQSLVEAGAVQMPIKPGV